MTASTTPADLESQQSDRPPTPAAIGYERAIDRDISGYSPLKRLGHYIYVYTRCIFGLIWIFVSGFFAKDATAAIEDFWENYVPHEYKRRHLVISWHAWFLWFTFDFIFDCLFALEVSSMSDEKRAMFRDANISIPAVLVCCVISIVVSAFVLAVRWTYLRPRMKQLGWDYPKEVLRDDDWRKAMSEEAIRMEKRVGVTTGIGEDLLQVLLTITVDWVAMEGVVART